MGDDDLLTIPEAAREMGMTRASLWRYIKEQRLPAERYGRDWLVRRHELDRFKALPRKPGPKPRATP